MQLLRYLDKSSGQLIRAQFKLLKFKCLNVFPTTASGVGFGNTRCGSNIFTILAEVFVLLLVMLGFINFILLLHFRRIHGLLFFVLVLANCFVLQSRFIKSRLFLTAIYTSSSSSFRFPSILFPAQPLLTPQPKFVIGDGSEIKEP